MDKKVEELIKSGKIKITDKPIRTDYGIYKLIDNEELLKDDKTYRTMCGNDKRASSLISSFELSGNCAESLVRERTSLKGLMRDFAGIIREQGCNPESIIVFYHAREHLYEVLMAEELASMFNVPLLPICYKCNYDEYFPNAFYDQPNLKIGGGLVFSKTVTGFKLVEELMPVIFGDGVDKCLGAAYLVDDIGLFTSDPDDFAIVDDRLESWKEFYLLSMLK